MYIYIYIYTRRKDEAKASSLLDHFGHFDAPALRCQSSGLRIFDAKAQVFDPRFLFLQSLMLKPRSSISELRC